jgi:hypothetical protein
MPTSLIVQFFSILAISVCGLAFWKGSIAERIGAAIIFADLILWMLGSNFLPRDYEKLIVLMADAVTALGLLAIALRYASPWLGGAMLLYAIQFTLHSYYLVMDRPDDRLHAIVNNLDFLGVVLCLAFGTVTALLRRRRIRLRAAAAAAAPAPAAEPVSPA